MKSGLNVLSLQPFYGGSHRAFMDGWIRNSSHEWTLLTLPDRSWKWRMRHAAIHFANQISEMDASEAEWDAIFVTDMLNAAELRGLLPKRLQNVPLVVYFHENQLVYPTRVDSKPDLHFAFTNLISTIAADQVWFNSEFNRTSMIETLLEYSKRWPDHSPIDSIHNIQSKSLIEYPGIELHPVKQPNQAISQPIHLVWAARWEHDKNPEDLLVALRQLEKLGVDFELSLIGPHFRRIPPPIETIKSEFGQRILNWGFIESHDAYIHVLRSADIFMSTAQHEFFGITVAEAASVGTHILLPDRLSYPELLGVQEFPERKQAHLYDGTPHGLAQKVADIAEGRLPFKVPTDVTQFFRERYGWDVRANAMDGAVTKLIAAHQAKGQ